MDYLDLIKAMGEDNLMRRANFLTQIQGSPEQALEFLNGIESVYKDHPQFLLARARAESTMAKLLDGAEKEGLQKSAYASSFNAYYWEQGQTEVSANAFNLISEIGRQDYGYFDNFYASDYPFRPYYPEWEQGGQPAFAIANAEAALKNSTSNLTPFNTLNWHFTEASEQKDKLDALMKSVEGRFAGHPTLFYLWAKNSLAKGDFQSAEKFFRAGIKAQPNVWYSYENLANMLIEQGQLDQAARLIMEYPPFKKNSNANPVGISNTAYLAGSRFYWLGEFSLARPLYEIASRDETGAESDMTSRLRLNLLDGHYSKALLGSLERAKRYNDTYAYRDYLGMLHAVGQSKTAWEAFNVLANQIDDPHIWESVLVGHRKEVRSEAEIAEWVKQQVNQNIGKISNHAAKYLLRAGVTDRIPSKELATALVDVAKPVWKVKGVVETVIQLSDDGNKEVALGPKPGGFIMEIGAFPGTKSPVKSNLVYFAESYRAIRESDFASAKALLQEASSLYDLSLNELGYLLPYYAFAAGKTGDVSAVEKYLVDYNIKQNEFDYLLAQAIISGIGGKTEESIKFLLSALYKRPYTENRPLQTEYQYAEICKLLYEATGKSQYKEMALDWAKKNQKFQPWFAWAYAMEAILTDNKADRKRAIGMASYLDPQSEMLGQISKKDREIAVKEFKGKNPFLKSNKIQVTI